ncbi:MAG: hypothetical protein H6559_08615 [Lewinellaceae bacterium]|nr:hypothetical protein [Lewinellaceae bacterium]
MPWADIFKPFRLVNGNKKASGRPNQEHQASAGRATADPADSGVGRAAKLPERQKYTSPRHRLGYKSPAADQPCKGVTAWLPSRPYRAEECLDFRTQSDALGGYFQAFQAYGWQQRGVSSAESGASGICRKGKNNNEPNDSGAGRAAKLPERQAPHQPEASPRVQFTCGGSAL